MCFNKKTKFWWFYSNIKNRKKQKIEIKCAYIYKYYNTLYIKSIYSENNEEMKFEEIDLLLLKMKQEFSFLLNLGKSDFEVKELKYLF